MDDDVDALPEPPATRRRLSEQAEEAPAFAYNASSSTKLCQARKRALEFAAVEREINLVAECSAHARDCMADNMYTPAVQCFIDHVTSITLRGKDIHLGLMSVSLVASTAQSHVLSLDHDGTRRSSQTAKGISTNLLIFGGSGTGKSPAFLALHATPMSVAGGFLQRNMSRRAQNTGDATVVRTLGSLRDTCQSNTGRVELMSQFEKASNQVAGRGAQLMICNHEGSMTIKNVLAEVALANNFLDGEQLGCMVAGHTGEQRVVNEPYVNICLMSQNSSVYSLLNHEEAMTSGLTNRLMVTLMRAPRERQYVPPDVVPTQRSGERRDPGGEFNAVKNLEELLCLLDCPSRFFALVLLIVNDLCHDNQGRPIRYEISMTDPVYERYEEIELLAGEIRHELRGQGVDSLTSFAKLPTNVLSWATSMHMMEEALRFAAALVGDANLIDGLTGGRAFAMMVADNSDARSRGKSKMSASLEGFMELYAQCNTRLDIEGWKRLLIDRASELGQRIIPATRRGEHSGDGVLSDALDFREDSFRVMRSTAALESALCCWIDSGSTVCLLLGLMKEAHDILARKFPPLMRARKFIYDQYASGPGANTLGASPAARDDEVTWRRACGAYILIVMAGFRDSRELAEVHDFFGKKYAALDPGGFEKKRATFADKLKKKDFDLTDPSLEFPLGDMSSSFLNSLQWNFDRQKINMEILQVVFKQFVEDGIGRVEEVAGGNNRVEWLSPFNERFPAMQAAATGAAADSMLTTACNSAAAANSSGSRVARGALTASGPVFKKFLPDDNNEYVNLRDKLAQCYGFSNICETFYPREHPYGERLRRAQLDADVEIDGDTLV